MSVDLTRSEALDRLPRPESLADSVYSTIRSAVVERRLAPGERVTEAGLAKQLGVSKTPVREALLRLHAVGLVHLDGRRGARVVALSRKATEEAYEVREALESHVVRLAAARLTDEHLAILSELADLSVRCATARDWDQAITADEDFHMQIAEAAHNAHLKKLVRDSIDLVAALRERETPRPEASLACALAHQSIVDALKARDPDTAEARMRAHVFDVKRRVLETDHDHR